MISYILLQKTQIVGIIRRVRIAVTRLLHLLLYAPTPTRKRKARLERQILSNLLCLDTLPLCLFAQLQLHLCVFSRSHPRFLGGFETSAVFSVFGVCTEELVEPAERGGEVVYEGHVVEVVMFGA